MDENRIPRDSAELVEFRENAGFRDIRDIAESRKTDSPNMLDHTVAQSLLKSYPRSLLFSEQLRENQPILIIFIMRHFKETRHRTVYSSNIVHLIDKLLPRYLANCK